MMSTPFENDFERMGFGSESEHEESAHQKHEASDETDLRRRFRHSITRLLSRREHSQSEIVTKLKQKGLCESSQDEHVLLDVLAKFVEKDLQSDLRFAHSVVNSAYAKGKGPSFVEQRLGEHNLEFSVVREYVYGEDFDWYELAEKVRQKRFGEPMPSDWQEIQKQKRFLQYRGFAHEYINEIFA